ncbi:AAA family ATPase [Chloroflexota bacterium]
MSESPANTNPLLCIVGMTGAGKSIVAAHLERRGWRVVHFGELTMRELKRRGLPISEVNERSVREELREEHGMDAFARLLLPDIRDALATGPTAVDGLYSWAEYKFLRENIKNGMYVIAVFSSRRIRYDRLSRRRDRPLTPEEAERRDYAEIENLEKGGPIAMADYIIINNYSEQEMLDSVDLLVSSQILTALDCR